MRRLFSVIVIILSCTALLGARTDEGFEEARQVANAEAVAGFHELAEWCQKEKLYGKRFGTLRGVLVLVPDDEDAHRKLGHKREKNGRWKVPRKVRWPRDHNEEAIPQFEEQRSEIIDRLRSKLLAAAEEAELAPTLRWPVFEDLLKLDKNDPETRRLLGEGRKDGKWVLLEVLRSDEQRVALTKSVRESFAAEVQFTPSTPNTREQLFGLPWTSVHETPDGRVIGTVTPDELQRAGVLLAAIRRHLVGAVLGKDARYGQECTVYVLQPMHRDGFIDGIPEISKDYRDFMRALLGSGIQGADDLAQWGPSEADRRDLLVREAVGWLMADAYRITTKHGWVHEGFGLYLSKQLVNTRLHWFAMKSDYGRVEDDQALRDRMSGGRSDWFVEALQVLQSDKAPKLNYMLGKDVNRLTTTELLVSHALAAYLLEGRPESLPEIWTKIGGGASSREVLEGALGMKLPRLQTTLVRWLEERQGEAVAPPAGDSDKPKK